MKIILARHGHAEDKKETLDDRYRELTEKGRKRVVKAARALHEYLEDETPFLWSSPAIRAMQTAKIISEELVISEIPVHDFIYSGNTEEGQEAIGRLSDEDIVILAGHQPSLGIWAKEMTGEESPIKKGQIMVFEVNDKSLKGDLVWSYPEKED